MTSIERDIAVLKLVEAEQSSSQKLIRERLGNMAIDDSRRDGLVQVNEYQSRANEVLVEVIRESEQRQHDAKNVAEGLRPFAEQA